MTPLCVRVRTQEIVHTHPHHVEKYHPLQCPLLQLPFFNSVYTDVLARCTLDDLPAAAGTVKDTAVNWVDRRDNQLIESLWQPQVI